MKNYHTSIRINKPVSEVWEFLTDIEKYKEWNPLVGKISGDFQEGGKIKVDITPLKKVFPVTLVRLKENEEMAWSGTQGSKFIIEGHHYYRLSAIDSKSTELNHGETFTGILSYLIPNKMIQKMKAAFEDHNQKLKAQLES